MDRKWVEVRQFGLNRATEKSADLFAAHRRRVTAIALGADGGAAAVLGAGNCNDVDLGALAARASPIHLIDLDGEALRGAIARQPEDVRGALVLHAGVDLSGILDRMTGWPRGAPPPEEIDAAIGEAARGVDLPAGDLALCLSSCLYTQMILSIVERIGERHPRCVDLVRAVRTGHLRTIARSLRRDGLGVIVSDMVSSDTVPDLAATPPRLLAGRMEALVRARNFFTGANPYVVASALKTDPAIAPLVRDVGLGEPWLWQIAPRRWYLVFAVRFRRTDREAP
jgi:hypothetical protein